MSDGDEGPLGRWVRRTIERPRIAYRGAFVLGVVWFTVTALFPLYWLLVIALTPDPVIRGVGLVPRSVDVGVFLAVLDAGPFLRYLFNSVAIAGATTVAVLAISSLAGYAFGRLEFRYKTPLLFSILLISFFPPVAFLMPLFRLFTGNVEIAGVDSPELFNTAGALIVPYSALFLPLSIFVLTLFFSQIPDGLEDAARIEGCTRLGALVRVIAPLSMPGLVTAGVLTFIAVYNEFFFAFLMVDGRPEHWATIAWGLQTGDPSQFVAAASLVALLPVAVLVFVLQSRITRAFDRYDG